MGFIEMQLTSVREKPYYSEILIKGVNYGRGSFLSIANMDVLGAEILVLHVSFSDS